MNKDYPKNVEKRTPPEFSDGNSEKFELKNELEVSAIFHYFE